MSNRPTATPAIPPASPEPNSLAGAVRALKEIVDVREGRLGDPLDKAVTFRELEAAGLLNFKGIKGGQGIASPGGAFNNPNNPGFGVDPSNPDFGSGDLTAPPAAVNVRARGIGDRGIMVVWDIPAYRNHSYTEIYRIPIVGQRLIMPVDLEDLYSLRAEFVRARPWGADNGHPAYVGRAEGSSFIDQVTTELDGLQSQIIQYASVNSTSANLLVEGRVPEVGRLIQISAAGGTQLDALAGLIFEVTAVVGQTVTIQRPLEEGEEDRPLIPFVSVNQQQLLAVKAKIVSQSADESVDEALNPTTYYYWVRFVSEAKVPGTFHVNPAEGRRTIDPNAVLTALTRELTTTAAYEYLQRWLALGIESTDPIALAGGLAEYLRSTGSAATSLAARVDVVESEADETYARIGDSTFWMAGILTPGNSSARRAKIIRYDPVFESQISSKIVGASLTLDSIPAGSIIGSTFTSYATSGTGLGMFGGKRIVSNAIEGSSIFFAYESWMPRTSVVVPTTGGTGFVAGLNAVVVLQTGLNSAREAFENLAIVGQEVMTEVTPDRAIGRHVQSVRAQIESSLGGRIDAQNQVLNQIEADLAGVRNVYSVNLRQEQNGIISAAGFALSLESADPSRPARSAFIISADQFAIMGSGSGATRVRNMQRYLPKVLGLAVDNSSAFTVGKKVKLIVGSDDSAEVSAYRGIDLEVIGVSPTNVDVRAADNRDLPMVFLDSSVVSPLNVVLAPEQSMPFIVDTNRNVVAIRGSLVVDGLITANDADIRGLLTAREIWAQSIIGQFASFDTLIGRSIIAGAPTLQDRPGTSDPATGVGQWRMGMFNPVSAPRGADNLRRVMTFHQPYFNNGQFSLVHPDGRTREGFYLDELGNVFIGGNCTVRTDGSAFAGFGVSGLSDIGQPQRFAMYVGKKSDAVSEANGIFWVGESLDANGNPRVGFNADVFLGDDAFSLPSGDGYVTVRQGRSGLNGAVFATATVSTIPTREDLSRRAVIGVDMYLIPASAAGLPNSNASGVTASRFTVSSAMTTTLNRHVAVFGSEADYNTSRTSGTLAGAYLLAHYQIDGKNDSECFTIAGSAVVPPGQYRIVVALWPKPAHRQGTFGAYAGSFFAMQVARGAAVSTGPVGASTPPPAGSGVNQTPIGETTTGNASPQPITGGDYTFFPPSPGGEFLIP